MRSAFMPAIYDFIDQRDNVRVGNVADQLIAPSPDKLAANQ